MSLPYDLDDVRRCPGMWFPSGDGKYFDSAAAYLMGIDAACHGEFLEGFHEWLVPTLTCGDNLAWTELILLIAFPQAKNPRGSLRNSFNDVAALECLFCCLEQFLATKEQEQGLRSIQQRYQDWLKSRDWYDPSLDYLEARKPYGPGSGRMRPG